MDVPAVLDPGDAMHAIECAGALFAGRDAIVVTAWRAEDALGSLACSGVAETIVPSADLEHTAAELAGHIANNGVRIAHDAGMNAEPTVVEVTGRIWTALLDVADGHDAATIVMGSRGLRGVRSMLLGSVSNAVARHARQPTLVVPRRVAAV